MRLEELQRGARGAHLPQVLLLRQDLNRAAGGGDFQARADGLAGAQLHQRGAVGQDALQENLDPPAGGFGAHHPRGDDAGVIEDQQITRDSAAPESPASTDPAVRDCPSRTSSRLAERSGRGACAISSAGSSKAKSDKSTAAWYQLMRPGTRSPARLTPVAAVG